MVNEAIQKYSPSTQKLSRREKEVLSPEQKAVLGAINKSRMVQAWGMLGIADAKPVADVWIEQFERRNVDVRLCNALLDRAIDRRVSELAEGRTPPPLGVDLILSTYHAYKQEVYDKHARLKSEIANIRNTMVYVDSGGLSAETAAAKLRIHMPFMQGARLLLDNLVEKERTFLSDHFLGT